MKTKLHEHEIRVLKALEKRKSIDIPELIEKTGLVKDSIEKASHWLEIKGLLEIKKHSKYLVEITKEGKEYVEHGLPERNLLDLVNREKIEITELRNEMKNFSIALIWVKRNDWVKIINGKLILTSRGKAAVNEKVSEEIVLSQLVEGRHYADAFPKETINDLEKRGLIKKREEAKKEFFLTEKAKEFLPKLELKEEIGQLTPTIILRREWETKELRKYDISIPSPKINPAKKHFMRQVIEYIRQIWLDMGFKEMEGPIVETSFWNFDALYQPQDHPARDLADTFYMKTPDKGKLPDRNLIDSVSKTHENGWTTNSKGWQYKWDPEFSKKCVLRTHTTSLSARTLASLKPEDLPAKFFSVGRCFRNETLDWKHLAEFYQTDGIVVDENVTFKDLLGYLTRYFNKLGFNKVRFRPSYFPYTEMSVEAEVWNEEKKEWVELAGAGIFRPEVVKPLLGKDIPVLAWGPTLDRIVMDKYEIKDIRELYWNDLKKLREAKMWLR